MRGATSRQRRRFIVIPAVLAIGASTLTTPAAAAHEVSAAAKPANVRVVDLRVNGLYDPLLGVGDPTPILSWRMRATQAAGSHRCHRSGPEVACPADEQTAYQIQAANSVRALNQGNLIWDSGIVAGSEQSSVPYAGEELSSREQVVWRVRVWDADGEPSDWSEPGAWEMGLLEQSDWGEARWIDYPGRTESDPMPVFARQFDVDVRRVAKARLYVSGLGVHEATVNGEELTDEVLAPGYSNFQLSAEYRTYDVTDELVGGSNTVGVQLGNWTAYVRRSVTNPAVGRTSPYSWWQSQLKGSGTLLEDAPAGATNVMPSSTANYHLGGTINVDTGDGGDRLESRVITNIGTAPTTVAAPNVIGGTPPPSLTGANWIWNVAGANTNTPAGPIVVRKTFDVADPAALASAVLRVNADDGHTTYVNGTQVSASAGGNNAWQTSQISDIKPLLVAGTNVIAIAPFNGGGAGSVIAVAELDGTRIVTDGTWKTLPGITAAPPAGWNTPGFDDSAWVEANVTGPYGIGPWNQNIQTPPGPTVLRVASVQGFSVGDSILIDTGANEEEKVIASVGSAGANGSGLTLTTPLTIVHAVGAPVVNLTNPNTGISFTPPLDQSHAAGALVTGSGNNIAASDPSAGAAVTPRMIARLEVTYTDGSTDAIVSDRSWRTAFGPYVTDAWYAGSDYDARREQIGWDEPGSDLTATATRRDGSGVGWIDAGIAPPPNLATQARGTRRAAGADRRRVRPAERDEPGPWNVRVRLRAELRRLATAQPHHPGAGGHRDPDGAGGRAAGERVRPRQPGLARPRRTRDRHVQHLHGRRRRARDLASRLPVLRDAVPPGHRVARGLSRDDGPHHRIPSDRRQPADRLGDDVERADQPDPPDGPVLVRQQHDVDLHRLPGSREAVLPGRLHDGHGGDRAQLRPRVLPARPHAPLRRGPVDRRHPDARQRRPEGAGARLGL